MLLAVVATLLRSEIVSYEWILVGLFIGSAIGVPMALFMPMTAMPLVFMGDRKKPMGIRRFGDKKRARL